MNRLILLALLAFAGYSPAKAQFATPATRFLQAGATVGPGLGVQAGLALPAVTIFTQEAALYLDYRFGQAEEQRLLAALGIGGSIRVMRILYIILDYAPGPVELDAGFRFGPSFAFSFTEQTAATRTRQFRLFVDPFARGTIELTSGRLLFLELGTQPGSLRSGILISI
jgi:hypothetical protein